MTSYTLRKAAPDRTRTDVVVVGAVRDGKGAVRVATGGEAVAAAYGRRFAPLLAAAGFTADPGEVVRVPTAGTIRAAHLVVVGLGDSDALTPEGVRRAAGVAARNVGNAASVALALPADDPAHVRAVADGFRSGSYRFTAYSSGPGATGVAEVVVLTDLARRSEAADALRAGTVIGEVVATARDWVNTPANDLTPLAFAQQAKALAKGTRVRTEVFDADALADLGCGGILGVGLGSDNPPCLVRLTWKPRGARGHVAIVGKGVTYDSGGYTIKPNASMPTMKDDMAGAAAAIATVHAAAALELPVAVTAWVPMAENMISGRALRPGDVLTMLNGKTVEVLNTDAEGRLIMADALTLAVRAEPDVILDIATLTGPCVVALGERIAGLFGDDDTVAEVQAAARATGELMWHLPIPTEQRTGVRTESKVADLLQHNWVRFGSASYAAAFLEAFTGDVPWAHLDIAGPAYNRGAPWGHIPSGGTGYGIPTLVEFLTARASSR